MKPKTLFQKRIVHLSTKLPQISDEQIKWSKTLFPKIFTQRYNSFVCCECGHKWKDAKLTYLLRYIHCPHCHEKIKYVNFNQDSYRITEAYFTVFQIQAEYQVVRHFYVQKWNYRSKMPKHTFLEVVQHWINPKGNFETLSRLGNNMNTYRLNSWAWSSELEPRSNTPTNRARQSISPDNVFPKKSIKAVIKRNGFKTKRIPKKFENIYLPAHRTIPYLLNKPHFETLFKTGSYALASYFIEDPEKVINYWPQVKMTIRNKYKVYNANTWFDYINLLQYFNKNIFDPKVICPENLKLEHDQLLKQKSYLELSKSRKQMNKKLEKATIKYINEKAHLLDLEFNENDVSITPLQTVYEFFEEGKIHKHCVYQNQYYQKKNSLVLSVKHKNAHMETIEISLKDFRILQSHGLNHTVSPVHKKAIRILNKNMPVIQKRVQEKCTAF